MGTDGLAAIKTWGNGDLLCNLGHCPFVKVTGETTGYCKLFMKALRYYDTGNNELCYRCAECIAAKQRGTMPSIPRHSLSIEKGTEGRWVIINSDTQKEVFSGSHSECRKVFTDYYNGKRPELEG